MTSPPPSVSALPGPCLHRRPTHDALFKVAKIPLKAPGIELGGDVDKDFVARLTAALGLHLAWDRATTQFSPVTP